MNAAPVKISHAAFELTSVAYGSTSRTSIFPGDVGDTGALTFHTTLCPG
jgi:hypothetical protein